MVSPWQTVFSGPPQAHSQGLLWGRKEEVSPGPSGGLEDAHHRLEYAHPGLKECHPPWKGWHGHKGPLFSLDWEAQQGILQISISNPCGSHLKHCVLTLFSLKLEQTLAFQNHTILLLAGSIRNSSV